MYDCSFLPRALFEFLLISDTHFVAGSGAATTEFPSRLRQAARAEAAFRLARALDPAFIIHLGDLVQEFPESPGFPEAIRLAQEQMDRCGVRPYLVAGNHDVGDKPDPTMPTEPVTPESLARYHARFGRSWYSFAYSGCHFVVLNSQIFNTGLPEAREQWDWLEADLEAHAGRRTFLFLHMPPYLVEPVEPALGHYDLLDDPDRRRLLDLVQRRGIEVMAAGHVHFAFYDRLRATRYLVAASPAFTRPGFPHLFTAAPPPERGRDDTPKLGFYLFRVLEDRTDIHFLRTGGEEWGEGLGSGGERVEVGGEWESGGRRDTDRPPVTSVAAMPRRVLTRTPAGLSFSALGVTLRAPLSNVVEIPAAWPALVREQARNDYPLLACLELGAGQVRFPWTDMDDSFQRERLGVLRGEGVRLVAAWFGRDFGGLAEYLERHADSLDGVEVQIPAPFTRSAPDEPTGRELRKLRGGTRVPLSLSCVAPRETIAGKQHPRTRVGFTPEELLPVSRLLAESGVEAVLCRVAADGDPWNEMLRAPGEPEVPLRVDWRVELATEDDFAHANRVAEALFAAALSPGNRVYLDPLVDLDRTMDASHGLLDTLCNPRPAFHVARLLTTLLHDLPAPRTRAEVRGTGELRILEIGLTTGARLLVLPQHPGVAARSVLETLPELERRTLRTFHLTEGTVVDGCPFSRSNDPLAGPLLIEAAG